MGERFSAPGNGPAPSLGPLLVISLMVMLNLTAFFSVTTGMDLYGFYVVDALARVPLPLVLSTLLNLVMASAAYACYRWLWRHQSCFTGGRWGPFTRGMVLSGIPVLLGHAPAIILTSHGGKPTQIAVAGLMLGSLTVTHALRDQETQLDPSMARHWFVGAIASILVFLILSIGGMLTLYFVEVMPASGNGIWRWEYSWADLGYPREEFIQRQRDGLVGYTLTGSGFMIIVLGGCMLGAILRWTRASAFDDLPAWTEAKVPSWASPILKSLGPIVVDPPKTAYTAVFGGYEVPLLRDQYLLLADDKVRFLDNADLVIDQVAGKVLWKAGESWMRVPFRTGEGQESRRSGPFLLLCIYATHPGRRFSPRELRNLLADHFPERSSINVTDFFNQLRRKRPALPVAREGYATYLSEECLVCLLTPRPVPVYEEGVGQIEPPSP